MASVKITLEGEEPERIFIASSFQGGKKKKESDFYKGGIKEKGIPGSVLSAWVALLKDDVKKQ